MLLTPDGRQLLDRASIAYTRWQNHSYYQSGLPLPGTPDLAKFDDRLRAQGLALGAPVFLRIFKLESELEIWMEKDGRYRLFATYPICLWSGRLGPKLAEGDRQAPEGFYAVTKDELNPNSRWHRSFSLGFPNAFDRALGRTGSFIMVHGGCQSIGCFAMTNNVVDEIWRLVTAALDEGQPRVQRPGLPVPHDREESGGTQGGQMERVLGGPEEGLRFLRAHQAAASGERLRRPLCDRRCRAWAPLLRVTAECAATASREP